MNLDHSRVLVLGATSAIAQEVCRLLAARQSSFFLAGRGGERLQAVAADLRVRGAAEIHCADLDLNDVEAHEAILDRAWKELGGVDAAVLAYGILGNQQEAEKDFTEVRRIFETNFLSASSWILRIAARFAAQRRGALAVISSVAGDRGRKSNFIYGTSKGALSTLLEGLRHRHYGTGITLLTVKPGMVDTPMTAHIPKSALFAAPKSVAMVVIRGLAKGKTVVYAPGFWRYIMLVIRSLPEFIFNKSNL
jgi:decaprenylphospho-beta-D-erythro-pentofuranosid-2-ulose 2-reductase